MWLRLVKILESMPSRPLAGCIRERLGSRELVGWQILCHLGHWQRAFGEGWAHGSWWELSVGQLVLIELRLLGLQPGRREAGAVA